MPEVKNEIAALPVGKPYIPEADEYLITDKHSICDILRWLRAQTAGFDEIRDNIEMIEDQEKVNE